MFSSRTKVWFFLACLSLGFLFFGEHWGGRAGLLVGFLLAVGFNALIFFRGDPRLLQTLGARPLKGRDPWGLADKVEALCTSLKMPSPDLFLIENATPSLFSVSFSKKSPALCLSTGLLEKLSESELEAGLAQQLCLIREMDHFGFQVTGLLSRALMEIAQFLDGLWPANFFFGKNQKPFTALFSPLGWLILRWHLKSTTHYENDRAAADLIQSRERLGELLWRMEGLSQASPLEVPPGTSHFFIVQPEGGQQKNFFLRGHPPMSLRLRSLIGTPTA